MGTSIPVMRSDDNPDAPVAWHYGDPHGEQRALLAGTARVDLSHRGVIEVSGPDRLTWLHDLTSGHLNELRPGDSATTLVLDANGRIEHIVHLVEDGHRCLLTVEPGETADLVAYLDRMRFWSKVEVHDVSADLAVVWSTTDLADTGSPEPSADLPGDPDVVAVWHQPGEFAGTGLTPAGEDRGGGALRYVPQRPDVLPGVELLVRREALPRVLGAADPAGTWALEALRVAAAVPRLGFETDKKTIPHEVGLIGPAVHLAKGCYRGQETVARVHNLGRPPRRLALAHLDGSEERLPEHGDTVEVDGRAVGWVASAARHADLGPVATVILKRSVPPEAALSIDGIAASQEVVVVAG